MEEARFSELLNCAGVREGETKSKSQKADGWTDERGEERRGEEEEGGGRSAAPTNAHVCWYMHLHLPTCTYYVTVGGTLCWGRLAELTPPFECL